MKLAPATALLVFIGSAAVAQSTQPASAPTTSASARNPAVAAMNAEITFYASFDTSTLIADLSLGDADALSVQGKADFAPGKFGQALFVNPKNGGARVSYPAMKNLSLARPGAVSFWMMPDQWAQPGPDVHERGIFEVLMIPGAHGGLLIVERMGFMDQHRRDDLLLGGFFYFPAMNNASALGAATLDWRKGDWHLVVFNWQRGSFELSVDGNAPQRVNTGRPLTLEDWSDDDPKRGFAFGYPTASEGTYLDELTVYRRPLTSDEIARMWRESK